MAIGLPYILSVGNIDSSRDWGYSQDYIEGMWLSLQSDKPDDFVFATGESHTIKELIEDAYSNVGVKIKWCGEGTNLVGINCDNETIMVRVDSKLYRTNDNMYLCGDSSKALRILGWKPKHKFNDIVKTMVNEEIENIESEIKK